jgi:hypothetical protein
MEEWWFDDDALWDDDDEEELYDICSELSEHFFLSDNDYLPNSYDDYHMGDLEADDWWPLVQQLSETSDMPTIVVLARQLDKLLGLPGVPTEVLEDPLGFLESVLEGHLPLEPSGRKVGSPKLVKIALLILEFLKELPETARAAARAWASVHRQMRSPDRIGDDDLADMFMDPDLPPAMTGFSMMIALTLMRWPKRAEGLPLPSEFGDPDLYDQVLEQWEELPDSPASSSEGSGSAEALFAQGQLAHMLAQMGTVELLHTDDFEEQDAALAYSRLSRAILWVHDQCRSCPMRDGVACRAATGWPDRPVPLVDVASEVANTSHIEGCIKM